MIFLVFLLAALPLSADAQEELAVSSSAVLPTYISLARNVNDFTRFADSGSDANWYVGYNNAWIVKLPPAPTGDFARAFIGAKLGRAKTRPNAKKPWIRETIAGKVYIGVSGRPAFATGQTFFLAENSDIPLESDPQIHMEGSGASDWFWVEVSMNQINFTGPNYLAVWSPTKFFVRASSAPILAAGELEPAAKTERRAWNNHSIAGVPPRNPDSALETPINFAPALAIKLVPPNENEVAVSDVELQLGKPVVAQFSVGGESVSEAWVEASADQLDWMRVTKPRRSAPFSFSIASERLPQGGYLRGAARDVFGNVGRGPAVALPYGN